ncbi:MAG TPA: hypothetical protein VJB16_01360, partial [archaeon]|nr:hypothetical protein [archaeon]
SGTIRRSQAGSLYEPLKELMEELRKFRVQHNSELRRRMLEDFIRKKLAKGGRWESEELRAVVGVVDGYHIMAHHLFFNRDTDPTWNNMAKEYKEILEKYNYPNVPDPSSSEITESDWLEWAWREAEEKNDREYKEFFYAVCSAKYLEGHIVEAFQWLEGDFLKKELAEAVRGEEDKKEEVEELTRVAKRIVIGIENPDARDPQHAGLFFLWRPHQLYAAVKTIRGTLKREGIDPERLCLIVDHEHIATQGVDAVNESRRYIATKPDYGELVISVHANHPHPLHPHAPLDVGDVILYELLYNLRVTGLGKKRLAYLMYERGGGDDPFKQSVEILKRMAVELEKSPATPPRELPIEFFGVKGHTMGDVERQMAIVRDKAYEPLKELLTMPEEEWTLLSQTAIQKGKKPETWKRAEFR